MTIPRPGRQQSCAGNLGALRVLWLCAFITLPHGLVAGQVAQSPLIAGPSAGCSADCGEQCGRAAAALPSLSTSTLTGNALFVQSGFVTATWEGYVTAYDAKAYLRFLGGAGVEPAPAWTANFPLPAERNILTSSSPSTPVAFDWCNLGADQRALLDPLYASGNACPVAAPPIIAYLRGDAENERRNGGTFRDRPNTVLGDVVNSTPLLSGANDHAYQLAPAASYSTAGVHGYEHYRSYVQAKMSSRIPVAMFGANDGMFHVLDARTGAATSGRELLAYVPRAVYASLTALADPAYAHRYSVDGPVIDGDVWDGTRWKTIAIGTTGAGAAGVFAIDVTAPNALDARSVLWDITAADHPGALVRSSLGLTLGAGVIGSVRFDGDGMGATEPNGAWAYVVGNGYESRGNTAALLVFNALDGSLIRAIDSGVGGAGNPNGLGAVTPVYDGHRNIVAVYAGDKLGNVWKFDLGSSNPANWKIFNEQPQGGSSPLFTASESGVTRPVHQAPRVAPHPLGGVLVAFGTGKYFEVDDSANSEEQGIFVLRDQGQVLPIVFGDLELIRTEEYTDGTDSFRRLYPPDLARFDQNDKGFWVRLRPLSAASSRERVIAPLFLDGGVLVVTTFSPEAPAAPCSPVAGHSYLYRIDLAGRFARGAFGAEPGTTIGRQVESGTMGGFAPLYEPVDTGSVLAHSMALSDLETMLANPRYRVADDGGPVLQGPPGNCMHASLRIDGSVARVATNCAGLMPLRSWRPMK